MIPTEGGVLGFPQLFWQGGGLYLLQNCSPRLSCQLTCSMYDVTCKQVPCDTTVFTVQMNCCALPPPCTVPHNTALHQSSRLTIYSCPVRASTALAVTQALCPSYLVHISLEPPGRLSPVTSMCILS